MTKQNAAALLAALRMLPDDPECQDRVVELGDGQVRDERTPEPGVNVRLTPVDRGGVSEPWVVRTFDSADSRPGSYPCQLPYLPGLPVMVCEQDPPQIAVAFWNNAPEPQALLSSLVSVSREQGWAGGSPADADRLPPQFISLSKSGARRVIAFVGVHGQSMLSVSDSLTA